MKHTSSVRVLFSTTVVALTLFAACEKQTTQPTNHDPVITSFVASMNQVQFPDTFSVTCDAFDSDGDSLLFNWGCPSFVTIEGAPSTNPYVFQNSKSHTITIYTPSTLDYSVDSLTISCGVIDGKGGWATTFLRLPLKR